MSFTNKSPSETYKDLMYVDNSNNGVDSTKRSVKSGEGSSSAISVSDRGLLVKSATDNTSALDVQNSGGTSKFLVDTTNNYVKANGVHVNTQYKQFSAPSSSTSANVAGYHYPLSSHGYFVTGGIMDNIQGFGNGTDPATSITFADTSENRASDYVTLFWYVPDAITIDSVIALEGADAATGDTTRFHLMGYDFTSGASAGLTNGVLLAHNSDTTNAGTEQIYKSTLTIDSANVSAGQVVIATFESDSINSDYSYQMIVKYHITG